MFRYDFLVKEIPAQSYPQDTSVERIMWSEEIATVAHSLVHMRVHHEETCAFEVEVGISAYDGVVADFRLFLVALHHELTNCRQIAGRFIRCEISCVRSEFCVQDFCDAEFQVQVGVDVQCGYWQHILFCRLLPCHHILPVEYTQCKILLE